MEVLQLPVMALQDYIMQELQENPTLELVESDPDLPEETDEAEAKDKESVDERELVVDEKHNNEEDFERLDNLDEPWQEYLEDSTRPSRNRIAEESDRKHDAMANAAARPETLQDHLYGQLAELDLSPEVRELAVRVIYNLNDDGRLATPLNDLLDPTLEAGMQTLAEEALRVVQKLDPTGVAARDLRECLLLQIGPETPMRERVETLVRDHLSDLEHNRLPKITKATGMSIEEIHEAWDVLRTLNPKPGSEFRSSVAPNVTPDVYVDQDDEGKWQIRLEDGRVPQLNISNYYRKRLASGEATAAEREFIKRKVNAAQWLIDSIEQRRSTLHKVAQAIVDHQTAFLDEGPDAIEPLKMQQIADKVGVHVTTVSRAVDDKWMQSPRGIYPLRRFFVGGTKSADGEEVAWDAVRAKLQEIIDDEDKAKPFSDDDLVKEMAKHGVKVARRTVTKYRKIMGIPSSRERKDWTLVKEK